MSPVLQTYLPRLGTGLEFQRKRAESSSEGELEDTDGIILIGTFAKSDPIFAGMGRHCEAELICGEIGTET